MSPSNSPNKQDVRGRINNYFLSACIGFCCLILGVWTHIKEHNFHQNAIHAKAIIETVDDNPVWLGGLGRYVDELPYYHECVYTLKIAKPAEDDYIHTQTNIFTSSACLYKGATMPVVFDPADPADLALYSVDEDPIYFGKLLIAVGFLIFGGTSLVLLALKCYEDK